MKPLKEHTKESIKSYFDDAIQLYTNYSDTTEESLIIKSMRESKEPRFAGLILAYARRLVGYEEYMKKGHIYTTINRFSSCPLCIIQRKLNLKPASHCASCPADRWCKRLGYIMDDQKNKEARELVVRYCINRGCQDTSWLPHIAGVKK